MASNGSLVVGSARERRGNEKKEPQMADHRTFIAQGISALTRNGEAILETALTGELLLDNPLLNKGSAFTADERRALGLQGLLPPHVATMEEQLARTYENYSRKETDLERYIFLASLQDRNETLFYRLLQEHIREMSPIIYTPEVGEACENYSHIYRKPRGLYISYPQHAEIDGILQSIGHRDVRVIVVTDGERILGLGDLASVAWESPLASLPSIHSALASIPRRPFRLCWKRVRTTPLSLPIRSISAGGTSACAALTTMPSLTPLSSVSAAPSPTPYCSGRISPKAMRGVCSTATATRCAPSTMTFKERAQSHWRVCSRR